MNDRYRMLTKIVRNMNLKRNTKGALLNGNEAEALRFISKHDLCISTDVVNYLNVDKGLIARIIKKLENGNYIECIALDDKRKKHLRITAKGLDFKYQAENFETEYYQNLFLDIDDDEQDVFFITLEKLYKKSKELRKQSK